LDGSDSGVLGSLRRSEELNRRLLEAMPGGVVQVARDGAVLTANAEAQRILGLRLDELTRRYIADFRTETFREDGTPCPVEEYPVYQCLVTGAAQPARTIGVRQPSGAIAWAVFTAIPLHDPESGALEGAVVTFLDITERKRAEDALEASHREREALLAQRLDALGVLSGGIAHDFNNLLTVIRGRLSLGLAKGVQDAALHRSLEQALAGLSAAEDLTTRLLTFARGGDPIKETVSVARFLEEAVAFVLAGSAATGRVHAPDDLWAAEIDRSQMFHVLSNLLLNAVQAMPQGGPIEVSARNVTVSASEPGGAPVPGEYVRVDIRDRGEGIAAEDLDRVFEPYFTTKPGGSGLGLSIAHSVVRRHGGHVAIDSKRGEGTVVTLHVPATRARPAEPPVPVAPASGRGRLLVMDDDPRIRELLGEMLSTLGYDVDVIPDGDSALECYRRALEESRPYRAVLLDLTVPGAMGGREALQHLRVLDPSVCAIVSSGYSHDPILGDPESHGFAAVLPKPYDLERLGNVLRRVFVG
jgi:PAS domain S-box-containing protein